MLPFTFARKRRAPSGEKTSPREAQLRPGVRRQDIGRDRRRCHLVLGRQRHFLTDPARSGVHAHQPRRRPGRHQQLAIRTQRHRIRPQARQFHLNPCGGQHMIVRGDMTHSSPGLKRPHRCRGRPRFRTGRRFHIPAQQGKHQHEDDGRLERGQEGRIGFHEGKRSYP